jgi:hypothetical protein
LKYDSTNVSIEVVANQLQVHTVESLFGISKDVSEEEVILIKDLTQKQRAYLGLVPKDAFTDSVSAFTVVSSSGGTLKVDTRDGHVIDCIMDRNEDKRTPAD